MKTKAGQRLAYYEVTAISDPAPSVDVQIGSVLIDRPRGPMTTWEFMNMKTGITGWITGARLGFARMDTDNIKPIPEPALQQVLDDRKDELK